MPQVSPYGVDPIADIAVFTDRTVAQGEADRLGTPAHVETENHEGREVYIVHADTTGEEGSSYDHIVYSIDKETCLPLQIEFFDTPENRLKLLKSDPESFTREGDGWVARSVTIQNLAGGTTSELKVEKIEVDVEVPDRMFTLSYLERRCR